MRRLILSIILLFIILCLVSSVGAVSAVYNASGPSVAYLPVTLGADQVDDGDFAADTLNLPRTVVGITKANPGVVTFGAGHGYVEGSIVRFYDLTEMTELNQEEWKLRNVSGNTAELTTVWNTTSLDTSGYGAAETTGGTCAREITHTNWTSGDGWNAHVNGAGVMLDKHFCDGTQGASTRIYQDPGAVDDKPNKVTFTISDWVSGTIIVGLGGDLSDAITVANGTYSVYLYADGITDRLSIYGSSTFIGAIDDVIVQEVLGGWPFVTWVAP